MAGRPKSVTDTKVFDVAKPGKSKPVGTSRPVIVSNREMVKDQTLVDKQSEENTPTAPSISKKVIKPINIDTKPEEETSKPKKASIVVLDAAEDNPTDNLEVKTPETSTSKTTAPEVADDSTSEPVAPEVEEAVEPEAEEAPSDTTEPSEKPASDTPEETSSEPEIKDADPPVGSDSANVDALAEATEKKKTELKEEEERLKKDAALQELIDSKQYVVPIAHDSGKGGHPGLWVFLLIILLAAGGYIALDAELVDVGIKLPYEFIKN